MRLIFALTVFALGASMGTDANAGSPDGTAPPEQRRFFGRFRRQDSGTKPVSVPEARREAPPVTSGRQAVPPQPRTPAPAVNPPAPDAPVRRAQVPGVGLGGMGRFG